MSDKTTSSESTQSASIINQEALGSLFSNKLPVPYLASLTVFVVLLLVSLGSILGLSGFAASQLLSNSTSEGLSLSSLVFRFSLNQAVLSQVAALIVALPGTIIMGRVVATIERAEPWRLQQKARRVIYTITIAILLLSLILSIFGIVKGFLEAGTSSEGGMMVLKTLIQGALSVATTLIGLFIITNSHANRNQRTIQTLFMALAVAGIILACYGSYQAYNQASKKEESIRGLDNQLRNLRRYSLPNRDF